jgi:hypothetical protein
VSNPNLQTVSFDYVVTGKSVVFRGGGDQLGTGWAFTWDFGDGTTGDGLTVSHAYTNGGTFTVVFTGTGPNGKVLKSTAHVPISGEPPGPTPVVTTGGGDNQFNKERTSVTTTAAAGGGDIGGISDLIALFEDVLKDPSVARAKAGLITAGYVALTVAMGILSLIPFESNVGAPLAALNVNRLVAPLVDNAYNNPVDLSLRQIFPSREVNPRILITGMENGVFDAEEVAKGLIEGGVTDNGVQLAVKVAKVMRFKALTADDLALVKTYHTKLIDVTIQLLVDEEKATIADLKAQRKTAATAKRTNEVANLDREIASHQALLREIPLTVIGPLADEALLRIRQTAAKLALPPQVLPPRVTEFVPGQVVTVTMSPAQEGVVLSAGVDPETGKPVRFVLLRSGKTVMATVDELLTSSSTSLPPTPEVSRVQVPMPEGSPPVTAGPSTTYLQPGDTVDTPLGRGRIVGLKPGSTDLYEVTGVPGAPVYFPGSDLRLVTPPLS